MLTKVLQVLCTLHTVVGTVYLCWLVSKHFFYMLHLINTLLMTFIHLKSVYRVYKNTYMICRCEVNMRLHCRQNKEKIKTWYDCFILWNWYGTCTVCLQENKIMGTLYCQCRECWENIFWNQEKLLYASWVKAIPVQI